MKFAPHFTASAPPRAGALSYDGQPSVAYRPEQDGANVAEFEQSAKGRQVRSQFTTGLSRIADYARRRDIDTAGFALFGSRVQSGTSGYFDTHVGYLYNAGKDALDTICAELENPAVPDATKQARVSNLARDLTVCATGSVSNLVTAAENLHLSTAGVTGQARAVLLQIVDQAILQHVQQCHAHAPNYLGNETHWVTAYRNFLAEDYGLTVQHDPHAPNNLPTAYLQRCRQAVASAAQPEKLMGHMADTCQAELHARFPDCVGRDLGFEDTVKIRAELESAGAPGPLGAELLSRYGSLPASLLLPEAGEDAAGESVWRLLPDTALLSRQIARNLREAGVFSAFKFPTVAATPQIEGEKPQRSIKQVGSQFYCKDRTAVPEPLCRPVQIADIVAVKPEIPTLTRAVMAATSDPSALAKLPPARAWRAIDGGRMVRASFLSDLRWVDEFFGRDMARYRAADADNGDALYVFATQSALNTGSTKNLLAAAIKAKDTEFLIRLTAELNDPGATLGTAITGGFVVAQTARDPALLKDFIAAGGDIDAIHSNQPALLAAAMGGSIDLLTVLFKHGADPQKIGNGDHDLSPILSPSLLPLFLKNGLSPNALTRCSIKSGATKVTVLAHSVLNKNSKAMNALISAGADIDGRPGQCPPLHLAVSNKEMLKTLIRKGADPNAVDLAGETALFKVVRDSKQANAELLIAAGADVNAVNQTGLTILAEALRLNQPIRHLLQAGARVDHAIRQAALNPGSGNSQAIVVRVMTTLHEAAACSDDDLVVLLLQSGGPLNFTNGTGRVGLLSRPATDHELPKLETFLRCAARLDASVAVEFNRQILQYGSVDLIADLATRHAALLQYATDASTQGNLKALEVFLRCTGFNMPAIFGFDLDDGGQGEPSFKRPRLG